MRRLEPRSGVAVGDRLPLRLPIERIHLFDPDSGAALTGRDVTTVGAGA